MMDSRDVTNLRECLEQAPAKTWTLTPKSVDGKVVEFTLKAKGVEAATFDIYGMISVLKE